MAADIGYLAGPAGHGDADFGLGDEWLLVVLAELHSDVEAVGEVFDQHLTFVGPQEERRVAPGPSGEGGTDFVVTLEERVARGCLDGPFIYPCDPLARIGLPIFRRNKPGRDNERRKLAVDHRQAACWSRLASQFASCSRVRTRARRGLAGRFMR